MKPIWRPITRVVVCLVLAGMACRPRSGPDVTGVAVQPGPVTLTLRTDKAEYYRGEPIFLECELTNNSKDIMCRFEVRLPSKVAPTVRGRQLQVVVLGRHGQVPVTQHGEWASTGEMFSSDELPPGRVERVKKHLNTFFDMTMDDEYTITAMVPARHQGPNAPPGETVYIQARPIRVKVWDRYPNPFRDLPREAPPENP